MFNVQSNFSSRYTNGIDELLQEAARRAVEEGAGKDRLYQRMLPKATNSKKSSLQEGEKRPTLTLYKGSLSAIHIPYVLGPEADKALRKHFNTLLLNEDTTRPRFVVQSRHQHPHPVGAFMRAYFGDLVHYKYAKHGMVLDIGTSQVRLTNRFDVNGWNLSWRVHSMAPILSGRDIMREMANADRIHESDGTLQNSCRCTGGQWVNRCYSCLIPQFDHTMSVDSIYYPGVLEEMIANGLREDYKGRGALGWVVFNDYDKARIIHGREGSALDKESSYVIKGDKVISTVAGNPAPYEHGFLRTGGHDTWQYHMFAKDRDGKAHQVNVIFETVEEFQNGDVPYKLCRVYIIKHSKLVGVNELEGAGVSGIPTYSSQWYKETIPIIPKNEILPVTKDTIGYHLAGNVTGFTRPSKSGDLLTDLISKEERQHKDLAIWQTFVNQYEYHVLKRNERFFNTVEEIAGKQTELVHMEMLTSKWYTLGLATSQKVVTAKLSHVIDAYLAIGNKKVTSSVKQACIQLQRAAPKEELMDITDAFLIARVMRAQEEVRYDEVLKLSNAGKKAELLK
jgi:hypothetical protein